MINIVGGLILGLIVAEMIRYLKDIYRQTLDSELPQSTQGHDYHSMAHWNRFPGDHYYTVIASTSGYDPDAWMVAGHYYGSDQTTAHNMCRDRAIHLSEKGYEVKAIVHSTSLVDLENDNGEVVFKDGSRAKWVKTAQTAVKTEARYLL